MKRHNHYRNMRGLLRGIRSLRAVVLGCAALLALGAPGAFASSPSPELAVNGSFESPNVGGGDGSMALWAYGPGEGPPGWHAGGNGLHLFGADWQAYDGHQSLMLASQGGAGSVYQDVPTVPGHAYQVKFAMAANGDPGCIDATAQLQVKWNGQGQDSPAFSRSGTSFQNMGWVVHTYTFSGDSSGSTTRLEFVSLTTPSAGEPGSCGPAIDGVSVTDTSAREAPPACAAAGNCNWDLAHEFESNATGSAPSNPFSDSYGYHDTWMLRRGGDDQGALADVWSGQSIAQGTYEWNGASGIPFFAINATPNAITSGSRTLASHRVAVHPATGVPAVVQWTSPITGTVALTGGLTDDDPNGGDGVGWHVLLNGVSIDDGTIAFKPLGARAFTKQSVITITPR